jgi:hypothetical protein
VIKSSSDHVQLFFLENRAAQVADPTRSPEAEESTNRKIPD